MHVTRTPWISARNIIALLAAVLVFSALYLSSLTNYSLFHSLAELSSVLVALSIFVICWNSPRFVDNHCSGLPVGPVSIMKKW
jgi:hypothetical protein